MQMARDPREAVRQASTGHVYSMAVKGADRAVSISLHQGRWYVAALELFEDSDGEFTARVRWWTDYDMGIYAGMEYERLESAIRQEMAEEIPTSTDPEKAGPFERELLKREQLEMALELGRWQGSRQETAEN